MSPALMQETAFYRLSEAGPCRSLVDPSCGLSSEDLRAIRDEANAMSRSEIEALLADLAGDSQS